MKMMRKSLIAVAVALLTVPAAVCAQEKVESTVGLDLVSHYMWRGIDKGGVTVIPTGKVSWKGASIQLQGTTGFDNEDPKEINLSLGYKLGPVNIGVTDYWTSGLDYEGRNIYFDWDAAKGAHRFEGNIGFTLPYFSLQAYTMFWGNDFQYKSLNDTQNRTNGKRAYSTYIELRVPFYMGGIDWDLSAGMTPFEGAYSIAPFTNINGYQIVQKEHYYAGEVSCIMASLRATKRLELGDMKVPIFAELHTNPYLKRANFVVGVSVQPF